MYSGFPSSTRPASERELGTLNGSCKPCVDLACRWLRSCSEAKDGPYPEDGTVSDAEVLNWIYQAIPTAETKWPIANKQKFARVLFEQLFHESGKGNDLHTCLFSGSGPAGLAQFSRGTWVSMQKTMGWISSPLTLQQRCDPWYAVLMQVCYMAQLLHNARGNYTKALQNYNASPVKVSYASGILKDYERGRHDYAMLESQSDPNGSRANAYRVEFP